MTKFALSLIFYCTLITCPTQLFANANQQQVLPNAVVKSEKQVRFTVLTPRLIRMEWDSTEKFVDNASFTVVNRNLPKTPYTISKSSGWFKLKTAEVELSYKLNSGKFNAKNLYVNTLQKGKKHFHGNPAMYNNTI